MRFVLLLRDHLLWALPWVCDFFAWGSAEKPDLRDAVCRGNASEVRELLDSGLDASLSNGYPWSCDDLREPYHTSVHHAAQEGLIDILRLLLAAWPGGAQARDGWGNTPGHYAASAGQMEALELLLSWWPEGLRTTDTAGLTLLHWAAAAGQLRVLEMLMQRWPEGIYVIDSLGRSLLHWAASKEHLDVLDLVLPRWPEGARVISNDGWTPLQQASCAGILHRGCNLTNSLPLLRDAAINLECGTSHELSKLELKLWLNCGGDPWYEGASGTPLSERLDALDAREFLRAKKAEEGYYSRLLSDYRTYVVPTAAIAVAWAAVLFEEHFDRVFFLCKTYSLPARRTVQMDVSEVAEDPFLEGAKLLVAQASAKRLPLHRLWRWLESMVAVIWLGFLLAYAHWPWWLPLVTLAYALPAVGLHRTRKTLQAPVLALMSQGFAGELAALLRNICLSLAFAICMLLRLGSNPAYREWQSTKLHNVWVKSHLNDHWLFVWAPEISARQIFLAAVIACSCIIGLHCALLCRAVLCACFCATTADGNETVERAQERHARERDEVLALLQERPDVARVNPRIIPVTAFALPWRGGGLYLAVGLVLLDVGLDINTIITFLGGKSFLFAASMTFIVARSFVKQVQVLRPWQLWQAGQFGFGE